MTAPDAYGGEVAQCAVHGEGPPLPVLLHDVLARRAAAHPAAPAFTVDGAGTLDYLGWHRGARRVAAGLAARGLRPGERVVLAFEDGDWLSFAVCFMGVLAAGGVAVPVRAPVPEAHLPATAARVEAAGLVTGGRSEAEAGAFGGWRASAGELTATTRGPAVAGAVGLTGADPAAVILTSGTTGAAKAVLSVHASLVEDWPDEGEDRTRSCPRRPTPCSRPSRSARTRRSRC